MGWANLKKKYRNVSNKQDLLVAEQQQEAA
jgi:hypothetical protein